MGILELQEKLREIGKMQDEYVATTVKHNAKLAELQQDFIDSTKQIISRGSPEEVGGVLRMLEHKEIVIKTKYGITQEAYNRLREGAGARSSFFARGGTYDPNYYD